MIFSHTTKHPVICYRLLSVLTLAVLTLNACTDPVKNNLAANSTTVDGEFIQNLEVFKGCYTVGYGEPAQIKISEQAGKMVMQMKEPARANRVWDDPEPLETLPLAQVPTFFSIDPNNVDAMLARPDKVLVLAHVKSAYANIDPLLDSEYLSYIYKGANTIYKVECDDTNTDILADPHANIKIRQVEPE